MENGAATGFLSQLRSFYVLFHRQFDLKDGSSRLPIAYGQLAFMLGDDLLSDGKA